MTVNKYPVVYCDECQRTEYVPIQTEGVSRIPEVRRRLAIRGWTTRAVVVVTDFCPDHS